jgi:hypothetical protein
MAVEKFFRGMMDSNAWSRGTKKGGGSKSAASVL